ncbi:hypothetical protein [Cobetia sp. L2A1]|nr:hypothetical protein [Cobetia sp. L2A1]
MLFKRDDGINTSPLQHRSFWQEKSDDHASFTLAWFFYVRA